MTDLNPRSDPNSPWWHIDVLPGLVSVALSLLGLAMVYSATRGRDADNFDTFFLKRQTMWVMAGFGLLVLMAMIDYRQLFTLTPLIYGGGIVMLAYWAISKEQSADLNFDIFGAPLIGIGVSFFVRILMWLESRNNMPRYITATWLMVVVIIGNVVGGLQ